mgnify:CR=1 FL=1|tara:strand:+ start:6840 stop:7253 length:414 start_codon:yes stop_codon:yes gene_type:complete
MSENLFKALIRNDKDASMSEFKSAIAQKMETAMKVRRIGLTSKAFNGQEPVTEEVQLDEAVSAGQFVKGGNGKINQSEVDTLLGKIYDDSKLTKALISSEAYSAGESNPKKKNPFKKDTIDFHLFQLGQQVESFRGA